MTSYDEWGLELRAVNLIKAAAKKAFQGDEEGAQAALSDVVERFGSTAEGYEDINSCYNMALVDLEAEG